MQQREYILKNRASIETNVLSSLFQNLDLYVDYKLSENDFLTDKCKFFFTLGKAISNKYNEIDLSSVNAFIDNHSDFKKQYNKFGGYEVIEKIKTFSNVNNISAYVDDLAKSNYLLYLDKNNIDMQKEVDIDGMSFSPLIDLFPDMKTKEIMEYYEGVFSKGVVNSLTNSINLESLILRDKDVEKLEEGTEKGIPYNVMFSYTEKEVGLSDSEEEKFVYSLPIMSNKTNGLHKGGGVTILAGFSGIGKSTIAYLNFILPLVYQGEKVVIFSNEQGSQYFKAILTAFVSYNVFRYKSLRRTNIINGDFTDEDKKMLKRIEKFLDDRGYEENLKFVNIEEFNIEEILRVSKGLVAHDGFTTVLIDTFKSEDASNEAYTGKIIENTKKLDNFGNNMNVSIFLTMQLVTANEGLKSYLTASDLAEAKASKNVADLLFLMRKVINSLELDCENEKFYLRPYRLKWSDKKQTWDREYVKLTKDEIYNNEYRLLFLNKSRHGEDNVIVLLEFHGSTGCTKEVGYVGHVYRGMLSR